MEDLYHKKILRSVTPHNREMGHQIWFVECSCGWAPQQQYGDSHKAISAWNAHMTTGGTSAA